jgi:hypothetical protein
LPLILTPHFKWQESTALRGTEISIRLAAFLLMAGRIVHHCIPTFCTPCVPPPPILNEVPELISRGELQTLIEFLSTPNLLPS